MLDLEAVLAPSIPLLHEHLRRAGHFHELSNLPLVPGTNICRYHFDNQGDIAQGFAEADEVFEDPFRLPPIYHYAMQPHVAIARFAPGEITVWTETQHPFSVRKELAEIFGLPEEAVL